MFMFLAIIVNVAWLYSLACLGYMTFQRVTRPDLAVDGLATTESEKTDNRNNLVDML